MRQVLTCRGEPAAGCRPYARIVRRAPGQNRCRHRWIRAAAQADNQVPTPGVQRRLLPVRPARSCWPDAHPLRWRREGFEPTALRHLDTGPLAGQGSGNPACTERPYKARYSAAVATPPPSNGLSARVDSSPSSAVGHGHFDQLQRLVNPAQSLGYRCASGLRATATFKQNPAR